MLRAPKRTFTMLQVPIAIATAGAIRAVAGTVLSLCTLVVAARFSARIHQKIRFQWDDWLMIPAWLFFVGLAACMIENTYIHTLGYSPAGVAPFRPDAHDSARLELTINVFLALCLGFTKLSAFQFYKRVFYMPKHPSRFKTLLDIANIATVCWMITFIIVPLSECGSHLEGYWIRPIFNKYCSSTGHAYLISSSATDVFFEMLVILLPVPKIWSLQTSVQRRMAITLVFATAPLSLAASIARLVIVVQAAANVITDAGIAAYANSAVFNMWVLESGAGVLAVNLPSLWYFVTRTSPEKAVHSSRSVISLHSICGRDSLNGTDPGDMHGVGRFHEPATADRATQCVSKRSQPEAACHGHGESTVPVEARSNRSPSSPLQQRQMPARRPTMLTSP